MKLWKNKKLKFAVIPMEAQTRLNLVSRFVIRRLKTPREWIWSNSKNLEKFLGFLTIYNNNSANISDWFLTRHHCYTQNFTSIEADTDWIVILSIKFDELMKTMIKLMMTLMYCVSLQAGPRGNLIDETILQHGICFN